MYASNVNYASLYSKEYFGKQQNRKGFVEGVVPNIVAFVNQQKLSGVLDVGAGSGYLVSSLLNQSVKAFGLDFAPSNNDFLHFDLSQVNQKTVAPTLQQVTQKIEKNYLLTCFDVLEHLDIEHVSNALVNIAALTEQYALVSINTRPSSADNAFHATLLPLETWVELFELVGLKAQQRNMFVDCKVTLPNQVSTEQQFILLQHWINADPFHDRQYGEPEYLLLKKQKPTDSIVDVDVDVDVDVNKARAKINKILGVERKKALRKKLYKVNQIDGNIGINIHHIQSFYLLKILLPALAPDKLVLFVNELYLQSDELSLIRGLCKRSNLELCVFNDVDKVDLKAHKLQLLLSAAESNVNESHIVSRYFVEKANCLGIATVLFQHGIWIEQFDDLQVRFGSQNLVTWGDEQRHFFSQKTQIQGQQVAAGDLQPNQIYPIGGLRLAELALAGAGDLRKRIGIKNEYEKIVLLSTNSHWKAHTMTAAEVTFKFQQLIDAFPQYFFIVKPHPVERANQYSDIECHNALILDDILLACTDLSVTDLIVGSDVVISSLSTLLLEAGYIGKPILAYQTGNRYQYQFLNSVALEQIEAKLRANQFQETRQFVEHYCEVDAQKQFFQKLDELLVHVEPSQTCHLEFLALAKSVQSVARHAARLERHTSQLALIQKNNERMIANLNEFNKNLEQAHSKLKHAQQELNQKLLQHKQAIVDKNEQIASKDEQITTKTQQIADINQKVLQHKQVIASKNEQMASKDQQITSKTQQIAEVNQKLRLHKQAITDKNEQIAGLNQKLLQHQQAIASKNEQMASKDQQIANKHEQILIQKTRIERLTNELRSIKRNPLGYYVKYILRFFKNKLNQ